MGIDLEPGRGAGRWWRRLLWFAVLWIGGLVVVSAFAYAIRAVIL